MPASFILAFLGPILVSVLLWNEDFYAAVNFNILRYVLGLHGNWGVNSYTHMFGMKPYDKFVEPLNFTRSRFH
jgi:stearoyl-CoA desaturase (Delta-9 desaturase)